MKLQRTSLTFIIIIFSILVLLTGCQMGGRFSQTNSQTTDFHTGTQGVAVSFLDHAPPEAVFESSTFDVQAKAYNKGAFDLTNYTMDANLKFNSGPVKKIQDHNQNSRYDSIDDISLFGKSQSYPTGEETSLAIAEFEARDIVGNFESDTAQFFLSYCYPYKTIFSESVCVDTNPEGTDAREQACEAQDHSYSGGQGAPVGITDVESQMIPVDDYIRPQFTIHIEQYGDGFVSDFNTESNAGKQSCGEITSNSINKVRVNARLGEKTLNCLPEAIRLDEGSAKIQCQLNNTDILALTSSYYTELYVDLSYLYSGMESKEVTVKRSSDPIFSDEDISNDNCLPWEEKVEGGCLSKCDYHASEYDYDVFKSISDELKNTSFDWRIQYSPLAHINTKSQDEQKPVYDGMSCMYNGIEKCREAGGNCIPADNLCFPGTYCGWPDCVTSNAKPMATSIQQTSDSISWICKDRDDEKDIDRTCGCSNKAYYAFTEPKATDPASWCENIAHNQFTSLKGEYSETFGMYFELSLDQMPADDTTVCIMVEDKLGEKRVFSKKIS
ncbi:MAG: hypothetical protein ACQESC_00555 [Nanobdellota archaeon]